MLRANWNMVEDIYKLIQTNYNDNINDVAIWYVPTHNLKVQHNSRLSDTSLSFDVIAPNLFSVAESTLWMGVNEFQDSTLSIPEQVVLCHFLLKCKENNFLLFFMVV